MRVNKMILYLLGSLLAVVVVLVYLLTSYLIPVNPQKPYFPNSDNRIGYHWNMGEFQPVYLFSFKKKSNSYIKVVYRGVNDHIKIMNILVGSTVNNSAYLCNISEGDDVIHEVSSISDYKKYLNFGSRVSITYLRNVFPREGDSFRIEPPTEENIVQMCDAYKPLCLAIKMTQKYVSPFWDFQSIKVFPSSLDFPAIWLEKIVSD